jgi:hypothetical protein
MFEDLEEENVDVSTDSPDRAIAWAIWSRSEDSNVTVEEAWAILHERYPDDPRFLLLNAYTELSETRKQSEGRIKAARASEGAASAKVAAVDLPWSPAYFLKKVERVLGSATRSEALHPQVRDLVVFGSIVLAAAREDEKKQLAELRVKIGADEEEPKRDDRDRAGIRLRRFEREVLKELDERTQDGKPLGVRAPVTAAAPAGNDWASATSDKDKPRLQYAADVRFARGELVEHPKFGLGVVTGLEPGKAVILFESGTRKLIAGS